MPVAKPGRSAKRSLTATGSIAPASPIPIPTGIVSSTTPAAPGHTARITPNVPTASTAAATATRDPARATRYGAGGAKTPMQSTGIVPSRPATAWLTPRSSWIAGSNGPTPTSCGRSVRAARNSATRSGPRRTLALGDGLEEGALARLHQPEELTHCETLEMLGRAMLLERGLVAVLLVEE